MKMANGWFEKQEWQEWIEKLKGKSIKSGYPSIQQTCDGNCVVCWAFLNWKQL